MLSCWTCHGESTFEVIFVFLPGKGLSHICIILVTINTGSISCLSSHDVTASWKATPSAHCVCVCVVVIGGWGSWEKGGVGKVLGVGVGGVEQ